jgi:hypothetical protein
MASSSKTPTFHSRTLADGYPGFPPILSSMLTQALGRSTPPVYLVFQMEPVPHLCRFYAKVHINPGPAADGKPMNFRGKPMPTPALAVQIAAAEAITRLRYQFPQVAEMQEFRYFPSSSDAGCDFSSAVGDADPAIARLVQFIAAQGLLLAGIIREFQSIDRDTTRVVTEAYRDARQAASQTTISLLPNSVPPSRLVPPSQPVLPSQPVNPIQPGIIYPSYVARAIRRLRRRDMLRQAPAATPAVAPQPIVVSDDEDGSWLSLRPPGEPQQE